MEEQTRAAKQKKKAAARKRRVLLSVLQIVAAGLFVYAVLAFNLPKTIQRLAEPFVNAVPNLSTAQEYYQAGLTSYAKGYTEMSRECMKRAVNMAGSDPVKDKALTFVRTKLPAKPVPRDAEQDNIVAYNLAEEGKDAEAERVWKQLIRQYPDFEWPYTNLASLYIGQGRPRAGEELVEEILRRNPHFLNGYVRMAESRLSRGQFDDAEQFIAQGLKEDPENYDILAVQQEVRLARKQNVRGSNR